MGWHAASLPRIDGKVMFFAHAIRRYKLVTFCFLVLAFCCPASAQKSAANSGQPASTLEAVLNQMDSVAAQFRSAEADFTQDLYQKVVNETDTQAGKVYFRRTGKGETQMSANMAYHAP